MIEWRFALRPPLAIDGMDHQDSHPTDPPASGVEHTVLVVGFCAAWCNTCGDFRKAFDDLAAGRPRYRFVWLDIEDDANVVGDIDIENFPTIAVFHEDRLLHFGVSLPQGSIVGRLLDSLDAASPTVAAEEAIAGLPARLRAGNAAGAGEHAV